MWDRVRQFMFDGVLTRDLPATCWYPNFRKCLDGLGFTPLFCFVPFNIVDFVLSSVISVIPMDLSLWLSPNTWETKSKWHILSVGFACLMLGTSKTYSPKGWFLMVNYPGIICKNITKNQKQIQGLYVPTTENGRVWKFWTPNQGNICTGFQ